MGESLVSEMGKPLLVRKREIVMNKPYLILVDGKLWDRKLTKAGALKVIEALRAKGLNAVLAYDTLMTKGA